MSDRTLALPGRALEQILQSLLLQSRRGGNYQQWPGAARLTTIDIGGGTAATLPNSVITTVLSLPLDAGSWMVLTGIYTQDTTAAPSLGGKYTVNAWVNIPGETPFKTSTTQGCGSTTCRTALTLSRRANLSVAGTVSLSVQPISAVTAVGAAFAYVLAIGA